MSSPQTFLLCDSAEHAEIVDQLIMEYLRERDHSLASEWSGIYTNDNAFGVLWSSCLIDLFGDPTTDQTLTIIEDTEANWSRLEPADVEDTIL